MLSGNMDIVISGDLDWKTVTMMLEELKEHSRKTDLTVYICSDGGLSVVGMAVYDHLRKEAEQRAVITVAMGQVASAALTVFLAGNTRLTYPHVRFMTHPMKMSADYLPTQGWDTESAEMTLTADVLADLYVERTNLSKPQVEAMLEKTFYFGAEEAVGYGYATAVL